MTTQRSAALAVLLTGLAGGPTFAATCNMTVQGTNVVDDAPCTIVAGRGTTRVTVGTGGTILIRRSILSARLPGEAVADRRGRVRAVSYGQVVASTDSDDKTCYFNQKAVLCVEP